MEHFERHPNISVALLVCNRSSAGVLDIAARFGVPSILIRRQSFYETEDLLAALKAQGVDWIVLAGFLWLVPAYLVHAFSGKIFNIHPALLPKYGGHGMYGHFVHEAVKAANESVSGMTIHLVNEKYDEGNILFQATCPLEPSDTAEDIARKVLALEHRYYAEVIENTMLKADEN
jgi:phosphoribosylglycinamide formyltransferase-1